MYTFRRPQQQQQPQEQNVSSSNVVVPSVAGASGEVATSGETPAAPDQTLQESVNVDAQQYQHQQEEQQQQQSAEYLSEEATAEETLRYCRQLVQRNPVSVPSTWGVSRQVLPGTVPELHLIPSTPVQAQQPPHIVPSSSVVLQLDSGVPEGMTPKEYGRSLVKYIIELLAYQRATTAITSLRFVKMGAELVQLVVTFGCDVRLAVRIMEEFTNVGLSAGFVAENDGEISGDSYPNGKKHAMTPCATFQVTDCQFLLNEGRGITREEVASLFQTKSGGGGEEMNVIPGFEPGVFYVAVKKPRTVFEWLWNPFCSFIVQYTLFERCGVLITMADCLDEFSQKKGRTKAAETPQGGPNTAGGSRRRRGLEADSGGTRNYADDGALYSGGEDEDNDDYRHDNAGGEENHGRNWARAANRAWSRNAKEEVDIFGGLDTRVGQHQLREDDFVDNDITELLQEAKTGNQKDENERDRQQRSGFDGMYVDTGATFPYGVQPPPPTAVQQPYPIYGPYYGYVPPMDGWKQPPPAVARTDTPPSYQAAVMGNTSQGKVKKSEYPELVEEETPNEDAEEANSGENSTPQLMHMAPTYWAPGGIPQVGMGGYYPLPAYQPFAVPPYGYLAPQQHPSHNAATPMPSILGQSAFGNCMPTVRVEEHTPSQVQPITINGVPCAPFITVDDVNSLAAKIAERVYLVFPSPATRKEDGSASDEGSVGAQAATPNKSSNQPDDTESTFPTVHPSYCVPQADPEVENIVSFLQQNSADIGIILSSAVEEFEEGQSRIVEALLVECEDVDNNDQAACGQLPIELANDMEKQQSEEAVAADGPAVESKAIQSKPAKRLPMLLPYLLANKGVLVIVTALASNHAPRLLPLLTRCILPFLLDSAVVQSVGVVALRGDPTAGNPLVQRLLRHWAFLAVWLHEHIQNLASESAQTSHAAAMGRLTSQVGTAVDTLLTATSSEQRESIKTFLAETKALETFFQSLRDSSVGGGGEEAGGHDHLQPGFTLWDMEGAVHRSLLRLYLNADFFNGEELATILYNSKSCLTRDHFYFLRVTLSKSCVSPTLSTETARLCGAFLRLMELMVCDNDTSGEGTTNSSNRCVFTDHDALNLLEAAFRVQPSEEAYQSLRGAYFATPASTKRFEQVEKRLLSASAPPVYPQHQPPPPATTGAILGTSSSYNAQPSSDAQQQPLEVRGWKPEWTSAMRHYPRVGEPFTPLPTGWTCAMSRSYGHYYFKNGKGSATYKHPTDETQFMVAPQAFLTDPKAEVTLDEVLDHANQKVKGDGTDGTQTEQPPIITKEVAEEWIKDQRVRVEALDMATLDLLSVTYNLVAGGGRGQGDTDGSRREHRRRHHSHRRRSRSKRRRSKSPRSGGERRHTERSQEASLNFSSYPARGLPFPFLPHRWTCNLSASKGLYYFRPPNGSPTFTHPGTGREYRVTPQAFALHRNIQMTAIAIASKRSVEDVELWLADQRSRDEAIDEAVVRMVPINYVRSSCDDDNEREGSRKHHRGSSPSRRRHKETRR